MKISQEFMKMFENNTSSENTVNNANVFEVEAPKPRQRSIGTEYQVRNGYAKDVDLMLSNADLFRRHDNKRFTVELRKFVEGVEIPDGLTNGVKRMFKHYASMHYNFSMEELFFMFRHFHTNYEYLYKQTLEEDRSINSEGYKAITSAVIDCLKHVYYDDHPIVAIATKWHDRKQSQEEVTFEEQFQTRRRKKFVFTLNDGSDFKIDMNKLNRNVFMDPNNAMTKIMLAAVKFYMDLYSNKSLLLDSIIENHAENYDDSKEQYYEIKASIEQTWRSQYAFFDHK